MASVLSQRCRFALDVPNPKIEMLAKVGGNWYDEKTNQQGVIDLGTAENMLCEGIVLERLNRTDISAVDNTDLYYGSVYDDTRTRETIAAFLRRKFQSRLKLFAENIVTVVGAGGAFDLLLHNLADPGECFLTPAPYYYWLKSDIGVRSQVDCISVPIDETDPQTGQTEYILSVDKMEAAYKQAVQEGKKVKGIVLNNPQNPTGKIYPVSLIHDLMIWAASNELHVVVNEIYGLTTFDGEFTSMTRLESVPDPDRTHLVWGMSKDLTLSGFRVGVIHSWNRELTKALMAMRLFCAVPAMVQNTICILLQDTDWLEGTFFPANHKRLRENRDYLMAWLDRYNIPHTVPQSTFYVWADFSQFLAESETEMDLFNKFVDECVYAEPGYVFHGRKRGFFRLLFSLPRNVLDPGLERMANVLDRIQLSRKAH